MSDVPADDVPLLVVDAANVVGSVPDGWWRDRAGATRRLRDSLARLAAAAKRPRLPGDLREGPLEIVLVVEGRARHIEAIDGLQVVAASGSGDDAIVEVVAAHPSRPRWVATADRELSGRVQDLGARLVGPRTVHPRG